ncbi:hypothetical protein BSPWISOXPB_569, partial [uncultured Gammaproteobacteria bacterium]
KNQSKITSMPALKKPFTLLLILSHLNAFVLGGVGNVYAANQEVNTVKSPQNFVDITANEVLNISSVQGFKFYKRSPVLRGFSLAVLISTPKPPQKMPIQHTNKI